MRNRRNISASFCFDTHVLANGDYYSTHANMPITGCVSVDLQVNERRIYISSFLAVLPASPLIWLLRIKTVKFPYLRKQKEAPKGYNFTMWTPKVTISCSPLFFVLYTRLKDWSYFFFTKNLFYLFLYGTKSLMLQVDNARSYMQNETKSFPITHGKTSEHNISFF